jgi:PKD repeat protein
MTNTRISSLDPGYKPGDLSLFPEVADDSDSLYRVSNNAETLLRAGVSYNGKKIIVQDATIFPEKGILRIGPRSGVGDAELVYYGSKTENSFTELQRGFAGSRQNQWPSGSWVTNAVTAEPHNAVKDAIINIENTLGTKESPSTGSMNKRLKDLELRFLSPKATFRAFPRIARPGQIIRFQNMSEGDVIRNFWDFGDGTQKLDENPIHSYSSEGIYTIKLHLVTSLGAQNIATKNNYIVVTNDELPSFFYVKRISGRKYLFMDQTDGDVSQRFWVFGDGNDHIEINPNKHFIEHEYSSSGVYEPSLLVVFASERIKRVFINNRLEVE